MDPEAVVRVTCDAGSGIECGEFVRGGSPGSDVAGWVELRAGEGGRLRSGTSKLTFEIENGGVRKVAMAKVLVAAG